MGVVKQIDIKNRTYYFYNDIIDLKNFDTRLLKKIKSIIKTLVFTILDILQSKKLMIVKIFIVFYPLYLTIAHANGYIKEKGVHKYLFFDSTDKNKELLKKCSDVFNGIRDKIKEVSSVECDYQKDYMKIKFNSDDNLPLNKPLKFHNMTITIRSVFEDDDKLYPKDFLDNTLYELNV